VKPTPPDKNAFTMPRSVRTGCQHMGGCACDVPYHLRESTPTEQRFEARSFSPPEFEIDTNTIDT
jgi:hypothetical protein